MAEVLAKDGTGGGALPPLPADALIIVPVRNTVLFPGLVLPITLGRPKSIAAAQQAVREQRQVGILLQRSADVDDPTAIDMHRMGTIANIVRYITAPDGTNHLVCQGEQRFQIGEYLSGWPFLVARVVQIPEPGVRTPEIEARFVDLKAKSHRGHRIAAPGAGGLAGRRAVDRGAAGAGRPGDRLYGREAGGKAGDP